jgi:hypothetical protein
VETRRTFVLWVSRTPGALEGRVEDVDTGRELRFQSADQLVSHLEMWLSKDSEPKEKENNENDR